MTTRCSRLLIMLLAALLQVPAGAADGTDEQAIRAVIAAQIDAFREDDGERAFSYAAPAIRSRFGNAERFMAVVRRAYRAVYRPRAFAFDDLLQASSTQPTQAVAIVDENGRSQLALYSMQRQSDGSWRIAGCYLAPTRAQSL